MSDESASNKDHLLARLDALSEKAISTYDSLLEYGKPKEQLETAKDILNRTGVTRQSRTGEGANITLSPEVLTGALQTLAGLVGASNQPNEPINVTYQPIEEPASLSPQTSQEPEKVNETEKIEETQETQEMQEASPSSGNEPLNRFIDQMGGEE